MRTSIFIAVIAICMTSFQSLKRTITYNGTSVAVAELFTSEGCSSCPAADETLEEMTTIMNKENKPVIGLAFHITYWDHLGWKDSFSQEKFTTRQKKYCEILKVSGSYTPQMVINGEYEFVGSNPVAFRETVQKVLNEPAQYRLEAQAALNDSVINISYKVDKKTKREMLNIALVEVSATRDIKRGENKNRRLKHFNVVRELQSVELLPSAECQLAFPQDLDPKNCAVVLFIQNQKNLKVLGASQINLTQ